MGSRTESSVQGGGHSVPDPGQPAVVGQGREGDIPAQTIREWKEKGLVSGISHLKNESTRRAKGSMMIMMMMMMVAIDDWTGKTFA